MVTFPNPIMLVKTALLIISNPKHIGTVLSSVRNKVQTTLYIHLLTTLAEPFGNFHPNVYTSWPKFTQTVCAIYSQAAVHCKDVDIRILLSGIKYKHLSKLHTHRQVEMIVFDRHYAQVETETFLRSRVANVSGDCRILTVDTGALEAAPECARADAPIYDHVVLGGTFDRLHVAHKHLLSEAILRSRAKITIGVTEENMLKGKLLWELIQPIEERVRALEEFLKDVCPEMESTVVRIGDAFGPTQTDPTMELIIVSKETLEGGHKCNEVRERNHLPKLHIECVELIDEPSARPPEEPKISSSNLRMRLLGTLWSPLKASERIDAHHHVIGLTGGIGSGKSAIANYMAELGADIIDCDRVGHECYAKDTACYRAIVREFGDGILDAHAQIDRKQLGAVVFQDLEKLHKLNGLVWPAIKEAVIVKVKNSKAKIVVVEAAILLNANWHTFCQEVWVTFIPPLEAVKRLKERNNLTEEQALSRINKQSTNGAYIASANVVLCTLWDGDYTKSQVVKAWNLLQQRLA